MPDLYVRGVETRVKNSLKRLAKKAQKVKKPNLNAYCVSLFNKHTKKEIEAYDRNGKN